MSVSTAEITAADRLIGDKTRPERDEYPMPDGLIHEAWDLYRHYQLEYSQVQDLSRLEPKYQKMVLPDVAGRSEKTTRRLVSRYLPLTRQLVKMARDLAAWEEEHLERVKAFKKTCAEVEPHYCQDYKRLLRVQMDNRRETLAILHLLDPLCRGLYPLPGGPRTRKRQVYDYVMAHPDGVTRQDVEVGLDLAHEQVTARMGELCEDGFIVQSGERRNIKTGNMAMVYSPPLKSGRGC